MVGHFALKVHMLCLSTWIPTYLDTYLPGYLPTSQLASRAVRMYFIIIHIINKILLLLHYYYLLYILYIYIYVYNVQYAGQ